MGKRDPYVALWDQKEGHRVSSDTDDPSKLTARATEISDSGERPMDELYSGVELLGDDSAMAVFA